LVAEPNQSQSEIFIVDDDAGVRETLTIVFSNAGYRVSAFADGKSFLEAAQSRVPACILLDVHMPERSGLDVLKELNAQQFPAPILIISGQGDIPMAVEAIKNGALDFIEKPFRASDVVARVRDTIEAAVRRAADATSGNLTDRAFPGHDQLTPREREVLSQLAAGASNKEAGRHLGISPRTVEVHRARIMEKAGAKNAADLVRIVLGHKAH
jgi:two-component system response regulator FixJ